MAQRSLAVIKTENEVFTLYFHNNYGKGLAEALRIITTRYSEFTKENIVSFFTCFGWTNLVDNFLTKLNAFKDCNDGLLIVDCVNKEYAFVNPGTKLIFEYDSLAIGVPYSIYEAVKCNHQSIDFDAENGFTLFRENITNKFLKNFNKGLVS